MSKFYVTKYALTGGIFAVETDDPKDNVLVYRSAGFMAFAHGEGREWHRTWNSATKRAEEMRSKKIASLKKSIEKMEKMTWREP